MSTNQMMDAATVDSMNSRVAYAGSDASPRTGYPARHHVRAYFEDLQDRICRELDQLDGRARFGEDRWNYSGGGGGKTRILQGGAVFEKAGVNFSAIESVLPEAIAAKMKVAPAPFFATGVSVVLHPENPMVPIVHMNVRYFEQANGKRWFGGGADLTPCYPFVKDVLHFHQTLRNACDSHDASYYPRFKRWCDEYSSSSSTATKVEESAGSFSIICKGITPLTSRSSNRSARRSSQPICRLHVPTGQSHTANARRRSNSSGVPGTSSSTWYTIAGLPSG